MQTILSVCTSDIFNVGKICNIKRENILPIVQRNALRRYIFERINNCTRALRVL